MPESNVLRPAMASPMGPAMGGIFSTGAWTPAALGSSLLAWWDAEAPATLSLSGGSVTAWTDLVAGYSATQAVGGSRPAYSTTSFNNRPGLSYDGVDDELTCVSSALLAQLSGAVAYELWSAADQQALAADATTRALFTVGSNTNGTTRALRRVVTGGVNRSILFVGTGGGSNSTAGVTGDDNSGRHVQRGRADGTNIQAFFDDIVGSPVGAVPATVADRVRLGAGAANTATTFWSGGVSTLLITTALSSGDAAQLKAYLVRRT